MSWKLYDEILQEVREEASEERVEEIVIGQHWCVVRTKNATGIAMLVKGEGPRLGSLNLRGESLYEVAKRVKSWNFVEASLGMAAVNAALNTKKRVAAMGGFEGFDLDSLSYEQRIQKEAFLDTKERIAGKKVAVIGHFPDLEKELSKSELTILERAPLPGDYPDSACEYILPHQDVVYITGTTLINKTLPRLMELCKNCEEVFLVGPSLAFSQVLFEFGIDHLSGFCVLEPERLIEIVLQAGRREIFEAGVMVDVERRKNGTVCSI